MTPAETVTGTVDAATTQRLVRLGVATSKPLRIRIVELYIQHGELSPANVARHLDMQVANISYHVRALRDHGVLNPVRTAPKRGALEHFYELDDHTRMLFEQAVASS